MHVTHDPILDSGVLPEADRDKVRKQLNRLLESHHFKNSRRYPALLRFIVEETLEGHGEFLKERLLGVRVFDRPADYDTATDPVVRVTVAEIRKRIAQYYHDEEHDAEIRIELLPGRYAPEFRFRTARRDAAPQGRNAAEALEAHPPQFGLEDSGPAQPAMPASKAAARTPARRSRALAWSLSLGSGLLLLALGAFVLAGRLWPSALDTLWAPILSTPQTVLFCIPTEVGRRRSPANTAPIIDQPTETGQIQSSRGSVRSFLDYESLGENVVYSDMLATLGIANILARHHRDYRVRLNVGTTLEDLRQGPAVLIGGLDNQWTMRALGPLRFHFEGSDEDRYWIADTQNPSNRSWWLDLKQQYNTVTRDYAIIARLHNEQTGRPEMIVAGIGMSGTAAAGEFITDEQHVRELRRRLGQGFRDRDFEVVISTDVVNGIAGAPRILAVSVW